MTLLNNLFTAVEATEFDGDAAEEMVASSIALLALSLSRLPLAEQEATLAAIEERHALRKAVAMFPQRTALPRVSNGRGAAH